MDIHMKKANIKILFVMPNLHKGGAEKVMSTIANNINKDIFDVTFVLLEKRGSYLDSLNKSIKLVDLNTIKVSKSVFALWKIIKKEKPNIVFSALSHLNLTLGIIKNFSSKKIKFIARETNIPSILNKTEKSQLIFNLLYRLIYRFFNKIVCQSQDMANDLIDNYNLKSEQLLIINNPVDSKKILKQSKESLHTKLFPVDKFNYISIGSFEYRKGFDLLLLSWAKVNTANKHLTLIGEGSLKKDMQNQIKKLNLESSVTILDFQSNPFIFLSQADVFILSSRFEGFPNILLESLACGTPAIAFECLGGINEIIIDGKNGWLIEKENTIKLAEKINTFDKVKYSQNEMGEDILNRYSIEKIISEYEKLFINLVKVKNEG